MPQIGLGQLPGHLLERRVRHVQAPGPHPFGGSRLPAHDLVDDPSGDAQEDEHGRSRVPGIVQPGGPDACAVE